MARRSPAAAVAIAIAAIACAGSSLTWLKEPFLTARWGALGALLAWFSWTQPRERPRVTPAGAIIVAICLLALASVAWSVDPSLTVTRAITFIALISVAFLGTGRLLSRKGAGERVVDALALMAAAAVLASLLTFLLVPERAVYAGELRGFFENANGLGLFLGLTCPFVLAALDRRFPDRPVGVAVVAAFSGVVALSASRSGLIALVLGLVAYEVARRHLRRVAISLAAIASLAVVATALLPISSGGRQAKATATSAAERPTQATEPGTQAASPDSDQRTDIFGRNRNPNQSPIGTLLGARDEAWQAAGRLIRERPVLGFGFGTGDRLFVRFPDKAHFRFFVGTNPNNAYLQLVLEVGFLGALLALIPLGFAGWTALETVRRGGACAPQAAAGAALLAGLAAGLVESIFTSAGAPWAVLIWLSAGGVVFLNRATGPAIAAAGAATPTGIAAAGGAPPTGAAPSSPRARLLTATRVEGWLLGSPGVATQRPPRPRLRESLAKRWGQARLVARREKGVVVASIAYLLFALNFGAYRVFGDGTDYFSFVQRLFGDRDDGSGYNFGVGLLNAPFYGAARIVDAIAPAGVSRSSLTEGAITIGSIVFILLTGTGCAWLLRALGLGARGLAVGAAIFGTPIWYYGSFSPSYSHAIDAFVVTGVAIALFMIWRGPELKWRILLGASLGTAVAVRPFNLGLVIGGLIALAAFRRLKDAGIAAVASAVSFAVLASIPLALGTSLIERAGGEVVGGASDPVTGGRDVFGFAPLSPLWMLLSPHRGLFVWTPVALLGVIGIALVLRRSPHRAYLVTLSSMAAGLLAMHASLTWWDAGWSFSMRLLASLVPLYAIGVAGLVAVVRGRTQQIVVGLVVAASLWSVFIGMNHAFGASQDDGAPEIAGAYLSGERSATDFVELTWSYSRLRHVIEQLPLAIGISRSGSEGASSARGAHRGR